MTRRASQKKAPERRSPAPLPTWLCSAALGLLGLLAYANSLHGVFIFDDTISIVENPNLRTLWSAKLLRSAWGESALLGRPLVALSFALNYALHGLDVRGYHIGNIALHLTCAMLLFVLIRRIRQSTAFAFACASLWMLHPLTTEVVNYISQRTESMMALFYLLTVYAAVRSHSASRPTSWRVLAVVASILGTLAKQSMVTIPLALLLVDYALFYDSLRSAIRSRWRFYGAVAAASWLTVTMTVFVSPVSRAVGFAAGPTPWVYLLNQSVIITHYLALVVWPHDLVSDYGYAVPLTLKEVFPQMALVGGLVLLTLLALRYRPKIGLLAAWVFLTLGPTSSVVPVATEVGAERRMYLPLMALVVLAVIAVTQLSRYLTQYRLLSTRAVTVGCVVLWAGTATALAARTITRTRDYSSSLQLATVNFERWPTAYARTWLGNELLLAGRHGEAIALLRDAARGGDARAYFNLGGALFDDGRTQEAREQLETFVRLRPMLEQAVDAREMIGRLLLAEGRPAAAVEQFQLVLQMRPSAFDAHVGLGQAYVAQERYNDAVTEFRAYFTHGGTKPAVWVLLASALGHAARTDEAIQAYRRAIAEAPNTPDAHRGLAAMLMEQRDVTAAVGHAERAVALNPTDAAARDLLGLGLAAAGRMDLAAVQFREALRLDPSDQSVREHLEQALRR
jgi:tetratricopeptide (TPR) repeat protein